LLKIKYGDETYKFSTPSITEGSASSSSTNARIPYINIREKKSIFCREKLKSQNFLRVIIDNLI